MLKLFHKGDGTAEKKPSSEFINLDLTWLNAFPPKTPGQIQGMQHDYHFFISCMKSIC